MTKILKNRKVMIIVSIIVILLMIGIATFTAVRKTPRKYSQSQKWNISIVEKEEIEGKVPITEKYNIELKIDGIKKTFKASKIEVVKVKKLEEEIEPIGKWETDVSFSTFVGAYKYKLEFWDYPLNPKKNVLKFLVDTNTHR